MLKNNSRYARVLIVAIRANRCARAMDDSKVDEERGNHLSQWSHAIQETHTTEFLYI